MTKFEIVPSQDKTEVSITIDGVEVKANALQLDSIIQAMAMARAQLRPAIPNEPPLGEPRPAISDPRYWTNFVSDTGDSHLMLQHPGLGWLSFVFPPNERDRLVGYLTEHSKQEPTPGAAPDSPVIH